LSFCWVRQSNCVLVEGQLDFLVAVLMADWLVTLELFSATDCRMQMRAFAI
jgi:hypothetical protein